MKRFTTLHGVAAPMPEADIDTDVIFPARFLVITEKTGLAPYAFHDRRFDAGGRERPGFVLHREPWRGATLLVAGANFGCGSSREQAAWALADLGLRCIVAPGFGEIFAANCVHNGLLPVVLSATAHAAALAAAEAGQALTVSLDEPCVTLTDGRRLPFEIDAQQRRALLEGRDEVDRIRTEEGVRIAAFEAHQRRTQPWLYVCNPCP